MDYELMMNGNVKIGQKAPDFSAESTYGMIDLKQYRGKWLIFFSHPADFTPVCTTEMIAFTNAHQYFKTLNTELLGLSVDSNNSHLAWMYDIYCKTGVKISFPIIADLNGKIARLYGMISSEVSNTETVRNVYIIDPKGYVRTILMYPMNIGRFIPEIIRTLQALQMADCSDSATAANWMPGQPVIMNPPKTFPQLEERMKQIEKCNNGISWYLSFQNEPKQCKIIEDKKTKTNNREEKSK